jgi:hypothetical protein
MWDRRDVRSVLIWPSAIWNMSYPDQRSELWMLKGCKTHKPIIRYRTLYSSHWDIVYEVTSVCLQRWWWCHHSTIPTSQTLAIWSCVLDTYRSVVADLWPSAGIESGNSAVWGHERQSKHPHSLPDGCVLLHPNVHRVKCSACGPLPTANPHQAGLERKWYKWNV